MLPVIEMAYRARRGDKSAIETLTAFKVKVISGNNRQYWPPKGQYGVSIDYVGGGEGRSFPTREEAEQYAQKRSDIFGGQCDIRIRLIEDE